MGDRFARFAVAAVGAAALALALLSAPQPADAVARVPSTTTTSAASALASAAGILPSADPAGFNAGDIIDDSLFWNGTAMTAPQIQAFIASKEPTCSAGFTCLKDYREATRDIPATPMCAAYPSGPYESAADIIAKVAQTCGVSPKVLLVVLQKEQGLVTSTAPSDTRYRSAMGAGCPDTAACDSNYYGFFNQVHYGAYLLKRYTQPAGTGAGTAYSTRFDLRFPVGQTTAVAYSPNDCGTKPVYIANQATHALYIYTPYTPNDAALAAGYGTGDVCSAYGNRNFYLYYSDWFGSVRGFDIGSAFAAKYAAAGGATGSLGYVAGPYTCGLTDSGCYQVFQYGWIVDSAGTDPQIISLNTQYLWSQLGSDHSYLGYPTSDETCGLVDTGCYQLFQNGWMVHSASTPLVSVPLPTRSVWWFYGNEHGILKYPTSEQVCTLAGGGCFQPFQGGWIVTSTAGAHAVFPEVVALWNSWGREQGVLGYPSGEPSNAAGGTYTQAFQHGTVTVTNGVAVVTAADDPWMNGRVTNTWLGNQTTDRFCTLTGGGCYQQFQNGWLVSSTAGVYGISTAVVNTWLGWGRELGVLGYPKGAPSAAGLNYTQAFQHGTVTVTNGVAVVTAADDPWMNGRVTNTWLGNQTTDRFCTLTGGGCYQQFQNGWLVSSTAGVYGMPTAVVTAWLGWGRDIGVLGFPSGAPSASGANYTQQFQGGVITVTNNVAAVTSVTDPWMNARLNTGWLGTQTTDRFCTLTGGGCYQQFQNGWLVSSTAGVYAVRTAAANAWNAAGRETSPLGFPSADPSSTTDSTYTQTFQHGKITVTNGVAKISS